MNAITTWVLVGLVAAMLVIMLLNSSRQKKAEAEAQKMVGALKPGDKVKTYIGVYGKIVSITETTDGKVCVIETGDKDKTRIELDMRAIAGLDTKQIAVYDENNNLISLDGKPVPKPEEKKEEEKVEEKKDDNKKAEPKAKKSKKENK